MIGPYIQAVETRLKWMSNPLLESSHIPSHMNKWLAASRTNLAQADTFYINREFCALVSSAAKSVPLDICFDMAWLQSFHGWAYLEQFSPFGHWFYGLPDDDGVQHENAGDNVAMVAFGWLQKRNDSFDVLPYQTWAGGPTVCPDAAFPSVAFRVRSGQCLGELIEEEGGWFENAFKLDSHPARWIFAALHLMSQPMSTTLQQPVDRAVRRRAARQGAKAPGFIKVVTLRRMEADRKREGAHAVIEWQWQWSVRGHWANQWYASKGVHKRIFKEAYIKGPPGKPFKSPGLKLFAAVR